jgi:hypothetical protein
LQQRAAILSPKFTKKRRSRPLALPEFQRDLHAVACEVDVVLHPPKDRIPLVPVGDATLEVFLHACTQSRLNQCHL